VTKLVFETATLADCLKKAFACTPKTGAAFDKAAGIVFEFNPTDIESLTIRATNLDVFYMEWVDLVSAEGPDKPFAWRFNSALISGVVGSLPIGSGKTVTLDDQDGDGRIIHLSSGRTKCKLNTMPMDHYPEWGAFDPDGLTPASNFAKCMEAVEWASDRGDLTLAGVHFDGEFAYATNKYKLAAVEIKLDIEKPVTLPSGILSSILSKSGEVLIGATDHQFFIMPDEHTQIRTVIYGTPYPNTSRIRQQENELIAMIQRAMNFAGSDRTPTMLLYIGSEEIAVMMSNEEMGMLGDVLEVPGQATHKRVMIRLTPEFLSDALARAPRDEITLGYHPDNPSGILRIDGGYGYTAWVMPRTKKENG
jgi:DNA polymerase III sliding clamp (beta) subunit (PCNA family)